MPETEGREPLVKPREIRYRLVDPEVLVACAIMRGVLERRVDRLARLADAARMPDLLTPVA